MLLGHRDGQPGLLPEVVRAGRVVRPLPVSQPRVPGRPPAGRHPKEPVTRPAGEVPGPADEWKECPTCHGAMVVPKPFFPQRTKPCGDCDGQGEVPASQ